MKYFHHLLWFFQLYIYISSLCEWETARSSDIGTWTQLFMAIPVSFHHMPVSSTLTFLPPFYSMESFLGFCVWERPLSRVRLCIGLKDARWEGLAFGDWLAGPWGMCQRWCKPGIGSPWRGSWKGKTPTFGENEAIPSVFTSRRGLMMQRLTDEWADIFRPKKILK